MLDAALEQSFFLRLYGCLWAWFMRKSHSSVLLNAMQNSAVLRFLGARLPLVSGLSIAVLFIIPHSLFNNLYSLLLLLFLNILLFLEILRGRYKGFAPHRMGAYGLVFCIALVFATLFSRAPFWSIRVLLFYITAFLGFTLCATVLQSRRDMYAFLFPLLGAVTVSGLYGCYQGVAGVPLVEWQLDRSQLTLISGRVFGFYDNPNNFAELLLLTLPFYLALFFLGRTRYHKLAVTVCAFPPALALIFTYTRAAWLSLCIGVALFFFLTYRFMVPLLCVAAVAIMPILPEAIRQRVISAFTGKDSSILYRATLRETLLPALGEYWFSGMGLGNDTVSTIIALYHKQHNPAVTAVRVVHAHNIYLQLWAETGIVGAGAFAGTMITFFRKGLSSVLKAPRDCKFLLAAGLSSLAAILVMGLVDHIWFYPRILLLFWLIAALTLTAGKMQNAS